MFSESPPQKNKAARPMSTKIKFPQDSVGGLTYIPSEVVVYKLAQDGNGSLVPTDHATLSEPAVVPLISSVGSLAKVYYNGELWWVDPTDLYEVEK